MHWLAHLLEKRPAIHGKTELVSSNLDASSSRWMPRVTFTITFTFTPYWIANSLGNSAQYLNSGPEAVKHIVDHSWSLCTISGSVFCAIRWRKAAAGMKKRWKCWKILLAHWPLRCLCSRLCSQYEHGLCKHVKANTNSLWEHPTAAETEKIYTIYIYDDMCEARWKNLHNILNIFWIITRLRETPSRPLLRSVDIFMSI